MNSIQPIIMTPGEPGGIGPEIALLAWKKLHLEPGAVFALLCDVNHLKALAQRIGLDASPIVLDKISDAASCFADGLPVLQRPLSYPVKMGAFDAAHASWVLSCIEEAAHHCLSGTASAMVTCPIQKESLYAAGFKHQGHTDYLASIAHKRGHAAIDAMMLVGGGLRAVPVTVHEPLRDVPLHLTQDAIMQHARIVARELTDKFGIPLPRLAVTGLNPHAGENGTIGREEIDIIMPAIAALRAEGMAISGPLPADTAFTPEMRESYDAILCMYHDQALIPVKALDFHGGVNVTLGLPFIRTSPDHGTALSIAGSGKARPDSIVAAIRLAATMAGRMAGETGG